MKKVVFAVFAVLMVAGLVVTQNSVFAQDNYVIPYLLKTNTPPTIDGDLSDWNFAFPIDFNRESIPNSSRAWGFIPGSDDSLSGTIMMMYDDNYLYVGARVKDYAPGYTPLPFGWAGDGVEIYLANWDIGDSLHTLIGGFPDDSTGHFAAQIEVMFDEAADSVILYEFYQVGGYISSAHTVGAYKVWPDEDGYNLEAKIYWADIDDSSKFGNSLKPTPGTRVPATWSLFSTDETGAASFEGYQYSGKGGTAPWQGASAFQCMDVMASARDFAYEDKDDFVFVHPYLKKVDPNADLQGGGIVDRSITVDGDLSDWNFAFPIDFNRESIPDSSRAWGFIPGSDDSLSGTIMMMYDDNYLYVGARVKDYAPGYTPLPFGWAGDGVEIYLANWDIGDSLHTLIGGFPDDSTGHFAAQIEVMFDEAADSVILYEFYQVGGYISSAHTVGAYKVWPDEDGYNLEAKIYWADIDDSSAYGNSLKPTPGTRIPATWSLFSTDETGAGSFEGYQYTTVPRAPWQGATAFQYVDVLGKSFSAALDTTVFEGVNDISSPRPTSFSLDQNYPNPFNPTTNIRFSLNRPTKVTLGIYNVKGQLVKRVLDSAYRGAGSHRLNVDMANLPSGVYIYVLQAGNKKLAKKMMLLK